MYFILSKLFLFLLYPLFWVFVLFIIAFFAKNARRKQRLFVISVLLLYFFSIPIPIILIADAWDYPYKPINDKKPYSCAIVLGGFTSFDKNGRGFFNGNADRFIQGLRLLETKKARRLLITGGSGVLTPGKQYKEGEWVQGQLKEFNVPDSLVLIENNSKNTIENAVFSKKVLAQQHLQGPYLLITSAFHMRRSMMIFKKEGYTDITPYPCNFYMSNSDITLDDLLPDGAAIGAWDTYLKEFVGYVVDKYKKG